MTSIQEIGTAMLALLRQELDQVRRAEADIERAQERLASARESAATQVAPLKSSLNALGIEIPGDLAESLRQVVKGHAQMGGGASLSCPNCEKEVKGSGGLAIHLSKAHGVSARRS